MINYSDNEQNKGVNRHSTPYSRNAAGTTVGIFLIAAGLILILSNMGIISWQVKRLLISWQMLLIAIGVVELSKRRVTSGLILVLIGGFFILPKLSYILPGWITLNYDFTANFWPLLIVIVGIIVIAKALFRTDRKSNDDYRWDYSRGDEEPIHSEAPGSGRINASFVFSGADQVFLDPVFRGGTIKTVFGGMTLDLRRTSLQDGITRLKIETVFGGVDIIVPPEWEVEVVQNSFLGGFSNKRYSMPQVNSGKKLIIEANCVFGGGEVK